MYTFILLNDEIQSENRTASFVNVRAEPILTKAGPRPEEICTFLPGILP